MKRVILVTGSGSGIGKATALRFAESGGSVIINDINEEAGNQVVSEIEETGGNALFVLADISDPKQVKTIFETAKDTFGEIEVLVNNAGVPGKFSLISDMPDETWHKTIAVHLSGSFFCMREAAPRMMANRYGRIINISSIAGLNGAVGSAEYGAAKSGIINLAMTASRELGQYNITVNAIAPGMVRTSINAELYEKKNPFIQKALDDASSGRMTQPQEIAELIYFLCTEAASNINGEVIRIDGGAQLGTSLDAFMLEFLGKKSPSVQNMK